MSTQKYARGYKKKCPCEKNAKMQNKSCQIALFRSEIVTESLKPYSVFCFDLQSCVKIRLYKLDCKCLTALLTVIEARLKDPRCRQNKGLYKFFRCGKI